jgi:ADP-ribose pyrophosphatase YjhB (NUDIX family)
VFGLITGFMEAGESPETGICREVLEETGLQVKALRLLGSWEFLRMNQVLIAYHVRVAGNPDDVRLSPELLEYRWVTPKPRAAGRRARATRWPTGSATRAWSHNSGPSVPARARNRIPPSGRCGHGAKMRGFSCRPPWRNAP